MHVPKLENKEFFHNYPNSIMELCGKTLLFFRDEVVNIEVYPTESPIITKNSNCLIIEKLILTVFETITPSTFKYKIIEQEWLFENREYTPEQYCRIFYTLIWVYYHAKTNNDQLVFYTTTKENTLIMTKFSNEKT